MIWRHATLLAILLSLCTAAPATAQSIAATIIPEAQLAAVGLSRGWITQLPLDRALTKIKGISLDGDLLLVMTSRGTLHVVDAQTGRLMWSMDVGDPRFQSLPAAADAERVAVVIDTRLLVMSRASGGILLDRGLTGTPSSPPTLLPRHVVVPLVGGPLEVYPLGVESDSIVRPQYIASFGQNVGKPLAIGDRLFWTDGPRILCHQFAGADIHFSERIPGEAGSQLAAFFPNVYVGTKTGYVVAFDAARGEKRWTFAAGSPMFEPPAALGDMVYVLPQDGGMFGVRAESGEELWYAPDPAKFVAATPERAYTLDRLNRLMITDAKSGARLGVLPLVQRIKPLANAATDRLYLYTDSGFIQCAHEAGRIEPHRWQPAEAPAMPAAPQPEEPPPSEAAPAAGA